MNTYRTSQLAQLTGIHPNTVRLYEANGLIPCPERSDGGYRIFTQLHLEQLRLARSALQTEVLQSGLRKLAVDIVKTSALGNYPEAEKKARQYLLQIQQEKNNAEEAIEIARHILEKQNTAGLHTDRQHKGAHTSTIGMTSEKVVFSRKEAAGLLQITMDTLRNWELNGLISVNRHANGYRIYTGEDLDHLKMIRSLRCANYSLAAILRMLNSLSQNASASLRDALNIPPKDEDIITACDRLLTSLDEARCSMDFVLTQISKLQSLSYS